jgi:glutaredoxin
MTLTIYSKNHCPYCDQAKALLKSKGIDFVEVKIDEDEQAKEFIVSKGHRTVPQLYLNGNLFVDGGYQGLSKLSTDEIRAKLTNNLGTL